MATGQLTLCVRCPACDQPIDLNATLRADLKRNVIGIDTAPIHAHISQAHPEHDPPSATAGDNGRHGGSGAPVPRP